MKNKIILIIAAIFIFAAGFGTGRMTTKSSESTNSSSIADKKSGDDFVGDWSGVETGHPLISITKQSTNTYSVSINERTNVITEFKDGVLIGELMGCKFTYTIDDGIITETTPEKTRKYKRYN